MIESVSSPDLLTAMDANMVAFYSSYGRAAGGHLVSAGGIIWFYSGIPNPLCNGVLSVRSSFADVAATVASLDELIASRGAPALWWVGPQSAPHDLQSLLVARGLEPARETPGMVLELDLLDDRPAALAEFSVETVDSADMRATWARTVALGSGFSSAAAAAMADIEAVLDDPAYRTQRRFLGFQGGVPVAGSALVLEAGVAGIYAVATIQEARNRGIGTKMTVVALLEARRMGYRLAVLQASTVGRPIYERLGFREICTYRLYLQTRRN